MKKPENNYLEHKIRNLLDDYEPEYKEEYWNMMQQKLNTVETAKGKIRKFSYFKYAATILLLFGISYYLITLKQVRTIIENSGQEIAQILLSDSSEVWLNNSTKLIYPEKFRKNKREVELEGEAYFEIETDPQKPYIVNTPYAQITVLGTKFNVQASKHLELEEVTVVEGKVRVQLLGNNKSVILSKGQKSTINKSTNTIDLRQTNDLNFLSWKTNQLFFINTPLDSVALVLSNHYKKEIKVADKKLKDIRLTSTISNQPLDDALQIIIFTLNIEIETKNDTIFIKGV